MCIRIGIFNLKKQKNFDIYMQTQSAAIQRRKRIISQYTWRFFRAFRLSVIQEKTRTLANFINMIYWMQTACSPRLSIMSRIHSLYVNTRIGERISAYAKRTCSCCDFGTNWWGVQLAINTYVLQLEDLWRNFLEEVTWQSSV